MELSDAVLHSFHQEEIEVDKLREDVIASVTGIDLITQPISYEQFFLEYLLPNKACILDSWVTEDWRSRKEWVMSNNKPNVKFLRETFGECVCPVADCAQSEYDAHTKTEMPLAQYITYIQDYMEAGYPANMPCLYLKDWHFQREFPDYGAYEVPKFFKSDWMNEFWDQREDTTDDYRFVYFGPKGSWTPFHSDVFRSYSWSANICGRKKWIIFPPGQEEHLKDKLGNLTFDLNSPDLADTSKYQDVSKVTQRFEVYQEMGQVIFLPSGWHHQVYNVEDTISINHNWSNGCNIDLCWRHLERSLVDVQKEISDCAGMEGWGEQCQLILKANAGMNYVEFYRLLHTIANNRIKSLQHHQVTTSENAGHLANIDTAESGKPCNCQDGEMNTSATVGQLHRCKLNHYVFDLMQIKKLICCMKRNKEFLQIDFDLFEVRPKALIKLIDEVVENFIVC